MKILFDTNIILDVLLNRRPFVTLSSRLVGSVENKDIAGYLCATTITTIDYLIAKETTKARAKIEIQKLLDLFAISAVNLKVLELSIKSDFKDFEDAVQYYAGICSHVDGLVTRNTKDFKQAAVPLYAPEELWGIIDGIR